VNQQNPKPECKPGSRPFHVIQSTHISQSSHNETAIPVPALVRRLRNKDECAWQHRADMVRPRRQYIACTLLRRTALLSSCGDDLLHDGLTALWQYLVECPDPPQTEADLVEMAAKLLRQTYHSMRAEARRARRAVAAKRNAVRSEAGGQSWEQPNTDGTCGVPHQLPPPTSVSDQADRRSQVPAHAPSETAADFDHELIPEEAWAAVEPVLASLWPPKRTGRRRVSWRTVLEAIVLRVLRQCAWRNLPPHLGSRSTTQRWAQRWAQAGILDALWPRLLQHAPLLKQLGCDWHQCLQRPTPHRQTAAPPRRPCRHQRRAVAHGLPPSHPVGPDSCPQPSQTILIVSAASHDEQTATASLTVIVWAAGTDHHERADDLPG
jgi:transposase